MHTALDSAMGLPRRSSSAAWMLGFLMPAEVRSSFTIRQPSERRRDVLERQAGPLLLLAHLALRQHHLTGADRLVGNEAQEVADDVEPPALLVVGAGDVPR